MPTARPLPHRAPPAGDPQLRDGGYGRAVAGNHRPDPAKGHFGHYLGSLRVGGGYECRHRNRGTAGPLSEHATGRALDVFGFEIGEAPARLSVSVKPAGDHQAFLAAVRQSACGAFATTLGPGSDAAHADHLHVDIKLRGSPAGRFCQ